MSKIKFSSPRKYLLFTPSHIKFNVWVTHLVTGDSHILTRILLSHRILKLGKSRNLELGYGNTAYLCSSRMIIEMVLLYLAYKSLTAVIGSGSPQSVMDILRIPWSSFFFFFFFFKSSWRSVVKLLILALSKNYCMLQSFSVVVQVW